MGTVNGSPLIAVTGAAGFLGRAVVAEARRRGHCVRALVRSAHAIPDAWRSDTHIDVVALDLAEQGSAAELAAGLAGVSAVIHAAARLDGTDDEHARDTVAAFQAVLAACVAVRTEPRPRLILIGSLAVYEASSLADGAVLDETCPLERRPDLRDAYCRAKLRQERLATDAARRDGLAVRILRVGALYGPGRLWNAHLGVVVGPALLLVGRDGELPTCHVDYAAAAAVRAAEAPLGPDDQAEPGPIAGALPGHIEFIDVVDPVRPSRREYLDALARTGWNKRVVPIGRKWLAGLAAVLCRVGLGSKVPGLLRTRVLAARMKPLRYSNARLLERLGTLPSEPFATAFARAAGAPHRSGGSDGGSSSSLTGPIAYLTGEYPRATDTFIQREVAALRRLGVEVQTCSIRRTPAAHHVGPEQRSEAARTFNVLPAAANVVSSIPIHLATLLTRPMRYLGALRLAVSTNAPGIGPFLYQLVYFYEAVVLADALRRRGAVHLHNHIAMSSSTVAMLASAVGGIPFSFTIHGADEYHGASRWRLDEKIARAAFVVCVCHHGRSVCMINSDRAHWSKLHIVHCGIDPRLYGNAAVSRETAQDGERLLFVGRIAPIKGVPLLFEAFKSVLARHPRAVLTMIGDGPDKAAMEEEARVLGIDRSVQFVGYKSQAEVAAALGEVDVLVLSSLNEGLPVVLMEALAARVPVVASRVSGIPELVLENETGLLFPPGSTDDLASAICDLLSDPSKRRRMGSAGRALVEREFDAEREAVWLKELLEAYASGRKVDRLRPAGSAAARNGIAPGGVVRYLPAVEHQPLRIHTRIEDRHGS